MRRARYSYRDDKAVPAFNAGPCFTVMDAQCALCARGARWIASKDQRQEFTIIPVQSDLGRALLTHYDVDPDDPASWLYVEEGRAFTSLEATIRAGRRLGGTGWLLQPLRLLPKPAQNWAYTRIARNRYRWFGRADLCAIPDEAVRKRLYQP